MNFEVLVSVYGFVMRIGQDRVNDRGGKRRGDTFRKMVSLGRGS